MKESTKETSLSPAAISELLQMPVSDEGTEPKRTVFSESDFSIPGPGEEEEEEEEEEGKEEEDDKLKTPPVKKDDETEEEKENIDLGQPGDENNASQQQARKKNVYVGAVADLIKENIIIPFEDGNGKVKPIEEYTRKEFAELITENIEHKVKKIEETAAQQVFDSLDERVQYVQSYIANGGKDVTKVFKHLAEKQELTEIDIKTEHGQEQVVRQWLASTNLEGPEIEDEISAIKDRKELQKKAEQFKPKLDALKERELQTTLKAQHDAQARENAAMQQYAENVKNVLLKGDLGGMKLTQNTQGMLYQGLVESFHSIGQLLQQTGTKTNIEHVAKVYWLLKDPKGFEESLKSVGAAASTESAVRKLKTESQAGKGRSGDASMGGAPAQRTLPRKAKNFFSTT